MRYFCVMWVIYNQCECLVLINVNATFCTWTLVNAFDFWFKIHMVAKLEWCGHGTHHRSPVHICIYLKIQILMKITISWSKSPFRWFIWNALALKLSQSKFTWGFKWIDHLKSDNCFHKVVSKCATFVFYIYIQLSEIQSWS